MDKTYVHGMAPKAKPHKQPDRLQQYSDMQGTPPPDGAGLDLSVEATLAMALQQRASAQLQAAAAKDAAFKQQLAMRERTRPIQLDVGPVEKQTQLDVGPVEVDGGTRQMGRHFDYRDMQAPANRRVAVDGIQDRAPQDGMPVYSKADSYGRQVHGSNIAAQTERGQPVAPHMYQGLTPEDITGALGLGGQMRGYGGDPSLSGVPNATDAPGKYDDGVYRGPPVTMGAKGYRDPMEHGQALDEFVQKHGYVPELFDGKSQDEALTMLARQLEAQRARYGDMGAFATSI